MDRQWPNGKSHRNKRPRCYGLLFVMATGSLAGGGGLPIVAHVYVCIYIYIYIYKQYIYIHLYIHSREDLDYTG